MTLIIQKFGGTSVANLERINQVADKIIAVKKAGHQVVVVSSAMSTETDRLIELARTLSDDPDPREYDALISIGEQAATALLSIQLIAKGCASRSYTGRQAGIQTNSIHKKARIMDINASILIAALEAGVVPVVAGFQGVDSLGNVTTLGRGGSDTTAVALAAALKADECQIYTDVDGVYTTDPRVVPMARRLDRVTFEEMLEMASLGAKVLQIRAVEFAGKYNVPLRVLSTFSEGPGTLITFDDTSMEQPLVSGIVFDRNQAKISLLGVPDRPGTAGHVLSIISDNHVEVDMIVQNIPAPNKTIDFSFTVQRDDYKRVYELLQHVIEDIGAVGVVGDPKVVKLSLVGVGMRSHAGVAATMFSALGQEGISIQLVSTSEIKISVIIDEKYLELGTRCLHTAFGLDAEITIV